MKNFLKLTAAAIVFVVAQNASAISLRFKFKTFSSGPSIYACNAGIIHKPAGKKVCYFEGTTNACTQNDCSDGKVCNTRCVCAGFNGGDYLMDYMSAQVSEWIDNPADAVSKPFSPIKKQAGQTAYATLHDDTTAFDKTIKELSFNLGSELYNASYYVDVCYRGPQIEYYEDQVNASFNILAQATATDFLANAKNPGDNSREGLDLNPGLKYTQRSDLKVQAFAVCDLQGQGEYKFARNLEGTYNTSKNEAVFALDSATLLPKAAGSKDLFFGSSVVSASASANDLIKGWINQNSTTIPRFCKIRYVFTETNAAKDKPNFRSWQRHGAEMCTYTEITEGATE